jgi:hypothetical protein
VQLLKPLAVQDVALATGDALDVPGVNEQDFDPALFENFVEAPHQRTASADPLIFCLTFSTRVRARADAANREFLPGDGFAADCPRRHLV